MPKLRHFALGTLTLVLGACATATPYQPASSNKSSDGFSQRLIENDRARVSFAGNSLTDRETVETYLIYRAAELTVENGFDHFFLTERDTEEKTRVQSIGSPLNSGFGAGFHSGFFSYSFFRPRFGWSRSIRGHRFGRRGFGNRSRFGFNRGFGRSAFFNDFDFREITKYRATAEVKFGRGTKPQGVDNAFTAREVLENLGEFIEYPEE